MPARCAKDRSCYDVDDAVPIVKRTTSETEEPARGFVCSPIVGGRRCEPSWYIYIYIYSRRASGVARGAGSFFSFRGLWSHLRFSPGRPPARPPARGAISGSIRIGRLLVPRPPRCAAAAGDKALAITSAGTTPRARKARRNLLRAPCPACPPLGRARRASL
jgi:hypothetical protein